MLGVNRFPKPQYRRTTGKSWISPSQNVKTSPAVTRRIIPVYKKKRKTVTWNKYPEWSIGLLSLKSSCRRSESSDHRLKVPKSEQLEFNAGRSCVMQMLVLQTSRTRLVFMPCFPAAASGSRRLLQASRRHLSPFLQHDFKSQGGFFFCDFPPYT